MIRLAIKLADEAAVADIESDALLVRGDPSLPAGLWYDIRPLVDPREVPPEVGDMARGAIDYALMRGLVIAHPTAPYLLRRNKAAPV
ncbi:MAG TPA: hypothetical protein PKA84_01370 [Rubrivivax sp.]|nr:hypothetical protein [Rubrivivax sp.]